MKMIIPIMSGILGLAFAAEADVIANYNFSADLSATASDANVTANALTVGAGLGASGRSGSSFSLFARASETDADNEISIVKAIAAADYFSFTVDVAAGFQMDLTSLSFDAGYTRIGSFEGKRFKTYLLTSIDGFDDAGDIIGSETVDVTVNGGSLQYPNGTTTNSLAGAQFQGITTSTEFRLYIADDTGVSDYIHRIDNLVLNGVVSAAVPEPSGLVLLGSGFAALLFARRRRAQC